MISKMKSKNLIWAIVVLVLILVFGLSYGLLTGRILLPDNNSYTDHVSVAISRVEIGTSREDAIFALSDAWFHSECMPVTSGQILDLFFYGSHDPDEVIVVVVRSQENDGTTPVEFVGSIENYMLHLYDHCIPLPESAFNES